MADSAPPFWIDPMLATLREHRPSGDGWAWELKWDGVRAMAHVHNGSIRLSNRTGGDITAAYPEIAELPAGLHHASLLLDGEIVAIDPDTARPSFQRLQARMHVREAARVAELRASVPTTFVAFDIVHHDGTSLIDTPYLDRRSRLTSLSISPDSRWQIPPHQLGDGDATWAIVEQFALEGAVAKRIDSRYEAGRRSAQWIKVKRTSTQPFVVGGWLPGAGKRANTVGSLCVGVYSEDGALRSVGNVGTGLRDVDLDHFARAFARISRDSSPFQNAVDRSVQFVEPIIVVDVKFSEWTDNATLRHPVFLRVNSEIDPTAVRREQ